MGTDDGDFAAPHQQGNGGLDEFVELVVEGGLVNDDVALFAAQVGGTTGQGGDTVAAGAANDEGEDVLVAVLDNFFCHGFRDQLVMLDPVGCIADKFLGHVLVVADVHTSMPDCAAATSAASAAVDQLMPMRRDFSYTRTGVGSLIHCIW